MARTDRINGSDFRSLVNNYQTRLLDTTELYHSADGTAEHLVELEEILAYLSTKGANHQNYRHYATRERVEVILAESAIYLTDGSNWNDSYDRSRFNRHFSNYKRFGICLSSSTEESIAMWMLYGGINGNGAMINFDINTLKKAMSRNNYELGHFNECGIFELLLSLDKSKIHFSLMEVLYFKNSGKDIVIRRSMGKDLQATISQGALEGLNEITKHASWAYEQEVRLVAKVDKLYLEGKDSRIKCVRLPLGLDDDFTSERVYNSPVSDKSGPYRDSELEGTVDWNLCRGCEFKNNSDRRL